MKLNDPEKGKRSMQRNAITTFLAGASLVFAGAMYYSLKWHHMTAFYALAVIVLFLVLFLFFIFRKT